MGASVSDGWRIAGLAREAVLNVFSRESRMLPLLVAAVVAGVSMAAFVAYEVQSFRSTLSQLERAGSNVVFFSGTDAQSPIQIGRDSCESLSGQPGIERAGLLLQSGRTSIASLGESIPALRASATLFPDLSRADIVVGSAFGLRIGATNFLTQEDSPVISAVVAPAEPDVLGTNASVVSALDPTDMTGEQCVVVLDPLVRPEEAQSLFGAQLAISDGLPGVTLGPQPVIDPVQQFMERFSRYLPIVLGGVGGLITMILFRVRTNELSTYRLSGTGKVSLLLMLNMEIWLIAGISMLSAAATGLTLVGFGVNAVGALLGALILGLTWAGVAAVGTADLAWRNVMILSKDR